LLVITMLLMRKWLPILRHVKHKWSKEYDGSYLGDNFSSEMMVNPLGWSQIRRNGKDCFVLDCFVLYH
jgi:hypothetical protein